MMQNTKQTRRGLLKQIGALGAAGVAVASQSASSANDKLQRPYTVGDLDLSSPAKRSAVIAKVMGSVAKEETHAFMRFHIYGFSGENSVPLFSMNSYLLQKWEPEEFGTYQLKHYEVGYYTEFDTDQPITNWKNPINGEEIDLESFVLGPVLRTHTPEGIISPGIAPNALRINVVGDRVFVPAQSIETFPNMFSPEEWPELSNQSKVYWDSMYTYSASLQDVCNPNISNAPAEIHMQNLTSWQPFLRLGRVAGRNMARAWGTHIAGFDALDKGVLADFEKYTPEIFETETWTKTRFDNVEYYQKMLKQRAQRNKS